MANWTYTGDPAHSDLDAVRREVGDTDINNQLLTDAEVLHALAQEGDTKHAAARCCEWLAREFAKQADKTLGQLSIKLSQKSKRFEELGKILRKKSVVGAEAPYAGGLSELERETDEDDSDLVQPIFKKDIFSNS